MIAWQKARVVRKAIRALVADWPPEEKFKLVDQIIRSSRGPCSNLAEGFGRFYKKENIRFCRIALGSMYETQDHLSAAFDEGYISSGAVKFHCSLVDESIRVTKGYVRYLKRFEQRSDVSEPAMPYGSDQDIFGPVPDDLLLDDEGLVGSEEGLTTDN
ncbi:MAG: four helix bundle protein [Flavobacteriales bacterium]